MHHSQEVYAHLPKQRRLDETSRSEAIQLLELKVNKELLQQHLCSSKGKVVTLKDISNLKSELPTKNNLDTLVSRLRSIEGQYTIIYLY